MRNDNSIFKFLNLIFSSFFRWWWAAITGVASLISLAFTPQEGQLITRLDLFLLTFLVSALIFLTLAALHQGWNLYNELFNGLRVIGLQKNNCYGSDYVFLLDGTVNIPRGSVVELKRFDEGVEGPMALVEIMEKNVKEQYQGRPIWISSGHQRDLKLGKFVYSDIIAKPLVQLTTIQSAKDELVRKRDL